MNNIKSIFEQLEDDWPDGEPLDFVDKPISTIYDDEFLDLDAQNHADWQKRVAEHFPMFNFALRNKDTK